MHRNLYIGLDVSTTAAKALVTDAEANHEIVARGEHAFKPLQTDPEHPGRAEQVQRLAAAVHSRSNACLEAPLLQS